MTSESTENILTEREFVLFKELVQIYIRSGMPVSSRALSEEGEIRLSTATIRNVMAALEVKGYIKSPHTSAGRIPTQFGYRFYVDKIPSEPAINEVSRNSISKMLNFDLAPDNLLSNASHALADISHFAGLALTIKKQGRVLKVEFLPLENNRILSIIIFMDGSLHHRVLESERKYTHRQLEQAGSMFNELFAGMELESVRNQLRTEMTKSTYHLAHAHYLSCELIHAFLDNDDTDDKHLHVTGTEKLAEVPEFEQPNILKLLLDSLYAKTDLLDLLELSSQSDKVTIFIGTETGLETLDSCSVVASSYGSDPNYRNVIGVIGPTRMNYHQIVPLVQATSELLDAAIYGNQKSYVIRSP